VSDTATPTEARVRAALLRLWARESSKVPDLTEFAWDTTEVMDQIRDDGDRAPTYCAVQIVGRKVAAGLACNRNSSRWSELEPGIIYTYYTYDSGWFTVRLETPSE